MLGRSRSWETPTRPPATPRRAPQPRLDPKSRFARNDALHAYRLFFGFLHGHVLGELQEGVEDQEEAVDRLRLALHGLPQPRFPQLRALGTGLSDYDGTTQLRQGVEMMIIGLKSLFLPPQVGAPAS